MNLAYDAMMFAREVHKDQRRKYTGNPYTDHLAEVVGIAMSVGWHNPTIHPDKFMAVCWLHDSVEDQGITLEEIERRFGFDVALGVSGLSDVETGNRAERKAASRRRLGLCSGWIQTIKCADLISNTASIVQHDPKFAVTYLEEKRLLLEVLTKADRRLHELALAQTASGSVVEARSDEHVRRLQDAIEGECDGLAIDEHHARAILEYVLGGVGQPEAPTWTNLEDMTAGELSAYEYGCGATMATLRDVLDGRDRGDGVANEPWESLKRRVKALMEAPTAAPLVPEVMTYPELSTDPDGDVALDWSSPVGMLSISISPLGRLTYAWRLEDGGKGNGSADVGWGPFAVLKPLTAHPPARSGAGSEEARDAARYRWLRDALDSEQITERLHEAFQQGSTALDAAIDAASTQPDRAEGA